jgi:OFA family oxalate/formate antiporter-like MFS transporter
VATLGGVLTGAGLILTSQTTTVTGYIVGFGLLLGAGIGLGYAAATPPALKWCAPRRTGMIAGIVVAGFGLASVYVAPLATWLITTRGIQSMLTTLGIGFVVVVVFFAQFLRNPPAGFVPKGTLPASTSGAAPKPADNYNWSEMLATPQFYLLWVMYAFAAGAGLMIVGKLAKIVDVQGGLTAGFIFVAVLAVGNAGGRVVAGMLSDRLGRITTMRIVFLCQAALMILLTFAVKGSALASLPAFVVFSLLLGANYGANLAVFPSVAKDYFGLKNFGVNYGLIFTAWGVGGFLMPYISGIIFDRTHSFTLSYYIAASLLVVATALSIGVKPPTPRQTTSA